MIKDLYIMNQNGVLLYVKHYGKEEFDDNIIIGFFASVANFSREALNSVVQNIDLGENNKLILLPNHEEKLLAAAIVNPIDDNDLVNSILKNIVQDFIDQYAPDYKPEKVSKSKMDTILEENLKGKVIKSPGKNFVISWIILLPLTIGLAFLSFLASQLLFFAMRLDKLLVGGSDVLFQFLPGMFLISSVDLIILFIFPNLINGFLTANKKMALFNSIMQIGIVIAYYFADQESIVFGFIIISYLPMVIIISLIFSYLGIRLAAKKKLSKF